MDIKYIQMDLTNDIHIKTILTLSRRNKFYYEDLYMILMKKIEPKSKLKYASLLSLMNKESALIDDNVAKYVGERNANKKGLFMTLDKKIIGFLTFDPDTVNKSSCGLSFFLIDKDYRRQGLGTLFMNLFIKLLHDINFHCVVKIEDNDNIIWYRRFGFKRKEECANPIEYYETMQSQFQYLYYIIQ